MQKHMLSIYDYTPDQIKEMVKRSEEMIPFFFSGQSPLQKIPPLNKVTLYFDDKGSTRTAGMYEEAAVALGFRAKIVDPDTLSREGKNESLGDTYRSFVNQRGKVVVMRTKIEGAPRYAAELLTGLEDGNISIQNAGDGANQHPSQAFLDLLTIKQKLGRLHDFTFGVFGDLKFGRTLHSLLPALSYFPDVRIKLVSAPETCLPERYKKGLNIIEEGENLSILKDCDVVYATRIQEERFANQVDYFRVCQLFCLTMQILNTYKKGVLVMHPGPINEKFPEIDNEVKNDPRCIKDYQEKMGGPTRMVLLRDGLLLPKQLVKPIEMDPPKVTDRRSKPLSAHIQKRYEEGRRFEPIEHGTVIDHLPPGSVKRIDELLASWRDIKEEETGLLVRKVKSKRLTCGQKDVLVLPKQFLTEEAMSRVTAIARDATINIFEGGTFTKMKVNPANVIGGGLLGCPNDMCITNKDAEAIGTFGILDQQGDDYLGARCHYCDRVFQVSELTFTRSI